MYENFKNKKSRTRRDIQELKRQEIYGFFSICASGPESLVLQGMQEFLSTQEMERVKVIWW
ncbi:hypothetical protein Hanom_Chr09g00832931 [Helianthus anomalus]